MQAGTKTRYIIHEILKALKVRSVSFDKVFFDKVEKNNFSVRDRKMIQNVSLNAMRYSFFIEKVLFKFAKKINKSSDSYFLLLSAITQLLILDFKDFAVINSTVELTKDKRIKASTKFINGILRNINRNKKEIKKITYDVSQLPTWFKKRVKSWDKNHREKFIKTISKQPNIHLVFKNAEDLQKIKIESIQTSDCSVSILNSLSIKEILGFKEGFWWVQDFSAMMPLYLTNNIGNKITADLCAAPGGKSFQLINYGAKVKAFERDKNRAEIMKTNLLRLKLDCKLEIKNVLDINDKQKFDLIILDAPCSSIGTIRRHPEIFFRKNMPNFKKIIFLQKQLLEKAKKLLKKDGILIYMVCSFLPEEGKEQVFNFLKKNNNFSILKFFLKGAENINNLIDLNGFYYVEPSELKKNVLIDGFFAAKLKKND